MTQDGSNILKLALFFPFFLVKKNLGIFSLKAFFNCVGCQCFALKVSIGV